MSVEVAAERRLLAEGEIAPAVSSHFPQLDGLTRDEVLALARWQRDRRGRVRDMIRDRRRICCGKDRRPLGPR